MEKMFEPFGDSTAFWQKLRNRCVPVQPAVRRLKRFDPRVVECCLGICEAHLTENNLHERVDDLCGRVVSEPFAEEVALEREQVDTSLVAGKALAERRCRKLKMGAILWFPELGRARALVHAHALVLRKTKGVRFQRKRFHRSLRQAGPKPEAASVSMDEAVLLATLFADSGRRPKGTVINFAFLVTNQISFEFFHVALLLTQKLFDQFCDVHGAQLALAQSCCQIGQHHFDCFAVGDDCEEQWQNSRRNFCM
jgi:hypothetical protein